MTPKCYELQLSFISPFPHDWQVARLAKGADACIDAASIQFTIAVDVQIPHSGARTKDADPNLACAVPVARNRQIAFGSELPQALVFGTAVPFFVPVTVEIPCTVFGNEKCNLLDPGAVP